MKTGSRVQLQGGELGTVRRATRMAGELVLVVEIDGQPDESQWRFVLAKFVAEVGAMEAN